MPDPPVRYLAAYLVPLTVVASYYGRVWVTTFFPFIFAFACMPLVDAVVGVDDHSPTEQEVKRNTRRFVYRLILYLWPPVQWAALLWAAQVTRTQRLGGAEFVGLALSIGLLAAQGVNVGHELFHKRSEFERYLGKALLVSVCYGHFFIEHVQGHHKRVGTPADPATARLGESFYRFLPRTLIGSYRSAWRLEHDRLRRDGLAVWGVHNQMLWFALLPLLETTAFYVLGGPRACALFLLQSVTAIVLLEMVNYIEHYGLQRRAVGTTPNGELVYEAVSSKHSWNAAHRITNYMLFKLQRHPDHHKHALHPYHVLRSDKESPQLPSSYPAMVVLLLIPPAWRRVMDARLRRYVAGA